jgi:nitrile hydratase
MQDMGPIPIEKNEPVLHQRWEARAFALLLATADLIPENVSGRFVIEKIPSTEYLRMSYHEKWQVSVENMRVDGGVVKREEIASVKAAPGSPVGKPALPAAKVPQMLPEDDSSRVKMQVHPQFKVKHHVRTRNINSTGHTRLPRYARGKSALSCETTAHSLSKDTDASERQFEKPQHVFARRFPAPELWGEQASPRHAIYIDMCEFALVVRLSAQGHFTWKEWANTLAGEVKAAADRSQPDDGSHYYEHWLAALESLVASKNLADSAALEERKEPGRTPIATRRTESPWSFRVPDI